MRNRFVENILNQPEELKPGQVWLLERDTSDNLPIEIVLTDTRFFETIGIVRGVALTRVMNSGDKYDVTLNKKHYPDTFPNGRVCLRFTDCALPKEKLKYFIDELTMDDFEKVMQSLSVKESLHIIPQIKLTGSFIEKLSVFRNEASTIYDDWIEAHNKVIVLYVLDRIKKRNIRSRYPLSSENLDNTISLDQLWQIVEGNKEIIVNLYENKNLAVDFILLDELPHIIFYSAVKSSINKIELRKGNLLAKAADDNFLIKKNGKFITQIDPSHLEAGEWTLNFSINKKDITIILRIE